MMTQITTTDLNAAWSGEIRVRFKGFTRIHYPRTVGIAMAIRDYHNKERDVLGVRVDGPPLPRTPKKTKKEQSK